MKGYTDSMVRDGNSGCRTAIVVRPIYMLHCRGVVEFLEGHQNPDNDKELGTLEFSTLTLLLDAPPRR